jgi:uncharacterized membrane protein
MLGLPQNPIQAGALCLASAAYTIAGISHFTNVDFFLDIMPPYLPFPLALVWISGVFEILGGLGLLVPKTRRLSSWGLIALLLAVFPANIHMMLNPDQFADIGPPAALYIRIPFQLVFMAWVWWVGRPDTTTDS